MTIGIPAGNFVVAEYLQELDVSEHAGARLGQKGPKMAPRPPGDHRPPNL